MAELVSHLKPPTAYLGNLGGHRSLVSRKGCSGMTPFGPSEDRVYCVFNAIWSLYSIPFLVC